MAQRKPRLGRGLEALIGPRVDSAAGAVAATARPTAPARTLPVDQLHPNPYQPRHEQDPESLHELAASIREHGVIQPIVVRSTAGRHEIIAGERRWQAARNAGLTEVPVVFRDASDREMVEIALVENIQREDLNPMDRARAYDRYRREFSLSIEALAQRMGEGRPTVSNYIRLLELPDEVADMVSDRLLTMGHARALLGLPSGEAQCRLARRILEEDMSVRVTEAVIQQHRQPPAGPPSPPQNDPNVEDLQRRISSSLGTRVKLIPGRKKDSGRLVIHYQGLDDFDRIMELLGIPRED